MSVDPGTAHKIGDKLGIGAKIKTPKDPVNPCKTQSVADRLLGRPLLIVRNFTIRARANLTVIKVQKGVIVIAAAVIFTL